MSQQAGLAGGPPPPGASPRRSHISLDVLEAFLESHAAQEPSAAVPEEARPRRSSRKTKLTSPPAPILPPDASLINPPNSPKAKTRSKRKETTHRPSPQITVTAKVGSGRSANAFSVLAEDPVITEDDALPQKVTAVTRAGHVGSGARGMRGGTGTESTRGLSPPRGDRQVPGPVPPVTDTGAPSLPQRPPTARSPIATASKEKQSAFLTLKDSALAATSFDDLAAAFRDLVTLIRDHRKSAPTTACLDTLNAFQSRLDAHHEFPREDETADSFSALLTKSVTAPIQILTAQLQVQHQAIQSLTKSVDSTKTAHIFSKSGAPTPGPTPLLVPKPKPVPITSTPDERILLRCDGLAPPAFSLPYHELVPKLNGVLAPLNLPVITCATRSRDGGLFLVPESKEAVRTLVDAWSTWGPSILPGARIIPPAVYSHIQVDGIFHAAVNNLDDLKTELHERYPELGPVVGSPV
ncbi:hypothetical protein B0H13DRAFT_2376775 [Mycena leptocephala]|nr:hypothetical protein B0H13DRAFT_2376775 [Mycena leptocephala]